jgi:hypothetical protein
MEGMSTMRTRLMIMAIVLAAAIGAIVVLALLVVALGWLGLAVGAVGTAARPRGVPALGPALAAPLGRHRPGGPPRHAR